MTKILTNDQVLTMLAVSPAQIAALTDGLTSAQVLTAPGDKEWSANAVLAHMRSCADVWGSCIVTILSENHPTIRAVNPRTWIKSTNYLEQEFQNSLQAFAAQRADLVALMKPLAPEAWDRATTVTGAGKVLERTVRFYLEWLAHHERPHLKQMKNIVSYLNASGSTGS